MSDLAANAAPEKDRSNLKIIAWISAGCLALWVCLAFAASILWHPVLCLSEAEGVTSEACEKALGGRLARDPFRMGLSKKYVERLQSESKQDLAEIFLNTEIKSGHDNKQNRMALADIASAASNYKDAAEHYMKAYDFAPSDSGPLYSAAWSYVQIQDYDSAMQVIVNQLAKTPDDAVAFDYKGWINQKQNKHVAAIEDFSKAIKLDGSNTGFFEDRAKSFGAVQNYKAQLDDLNSLVLLNRSSQNLETRAFYFKSRAKYDFALNDFEAAMEIEPSQYFTENIIDVLIDAKKLPDAQKKADELRTSFAEEIVTWRATCRVANAQKDWDTAKIAADKLKTLDKEGVASLRCLASTEEAKDNFALAIRHHKAILSIYESDLTAMQDIGHNFIALDLPQIALKWFDKEIKADPTNAWAYSDRARAHIYLENWQQAINDAEKAMALSPDVGIAYARRAFARAKLNNIEAALADYRKAVTIDPTLDWAWDDYAELLDKNGKPQLAEAVRKEKP